MNRYTAHANFAAVNRSAVIRIEPNAVADGIVIEGSRFVIAVGVVIDTAAAITFSADGAGLGGPGNGSGVGGGIRAGQVIG